MKIYKNFIVLFCLTTFASDFNAREAERPLTMAESIAVGGVVGAAEVAMPGQILTYAMNQAVKQQPFVFTDSYKGFGVNAMGQMPITAVQKAVQTKGSQFLERYQEAPLSDSQKAAISYASGVAGALIDTPSNAVQLYMQDPANARKTTLQSISDLRMKAFRGFIPNALFKEGLFALGYQMIAPKYQEIAAGYVGDNLAAAALGGTAAGVFTAILTQPGAVLRNKMQGDLYGARYTTTWKTAQEIMRAEGFRGLFRGLPQRGTRVALAVPLYVAYTTYMENKLRGR